MKRERIIKVYDVVKRDNIILRKEEFDIIYEILGDITSNKRKYRDIISFVDASLKFDFDFCDNDSFLDILFELPNCAGDYYNISVGKKEIIQIYVKEKN